MRSIILAVSFLALAITGLSQSVNLDRFYVKLSERNLPKVPFPVGARTFSVHTSFNAFVSEIYSPEEYETNAIKIVGLERKDEGGTLKIKYVFFPIDVKEISVKENKHEEKDKNGNITKVTYTYNGVMTYSVGSEYTITDPSGKILKMEVLENPTGNKTFESEPFSQYKDAASYIKLNREILVEKLTRQFIANSVKAINTFSNEQFGYQEVANNPLFWYLGTEKHPEFQAHADNFKQAKEILEKIDANGGIAEARDRIKPVIEYLESVKTRYTGDDKKDRKMRYASFYNLAQIYLLLEMHDEVIKQAEGLIANDYDKGDGKSFIKQVEKQKEAFKRNETNTSHFPIDWLSNAK